MNAEKEKMEEPKWTFCPRCGKPLPSDIDVRFCMICGMDLEYFRQFGTFPTIYQPSSHITRILLQDDELIDTKGKKLWSIPSSLLIPIAAFIALSIMLVVITILLIATIILLPSSFIGDIYELLYSPLFTTLLTLSELIFLIIPLFIVKKFIQKPSYKNSIKLLGVYNDRRIKNYLLKEVLIGISFAVGAYLVVQLVSFLTDLSFSAIFGQQALENAYGTYQEGVGGAITANSIMELIISMILMIVIIGPSEEVMFRGFSQKGLDRKVGKQWAIVISTLLFTFFHVIPGLMPLDLFLLLFPPYLIISLMLCSLYVWRKENLIACIIGHGVYNALTILIAFLI